MMSTGQALPDDALQFARASARRTLEIAKIELRLYAQVEYPRQLRLLEAQIKLTDAEIKLFRERVRAYREFDSFSTGQPLAFPFPDVRLRLLEAELRLENLRAEQNALTRLHSDQWRLLELRVHEARARVAELEGGDIIVLPREVLPAGR
jgi:hypothetical protein